MTGFDRGGNGGNGPRSTSKMATSSASPGRPAARPGPTSERIVRASDETVKAIPALLSQAEGYSAYAGIGSRETPLDVVAEMEAIAAALQARGHVMRSGGADGKKGQAPGTGSADVAFERGISDRSKKEIYIPWAGFAGSKDGIVLPRALETKAYEIASRAHPAWDRCSDGARKLHTRNVPQVLGQDLQTPVKFVMCWTVDGGATGGTGQAIRIATNERIPVLNLRDDRVRDAVLAELGLERQRMRSVDVARDAARNRAQEAAASQNTAEPFDLSVGSRPSQAWDRASSATFCKVREANGECSNMSNEFPYEDGGLRWQSTEAQYQAARYPDRPDIQELIRAAPNAYVAKQVSKEHYALTRPDWDEVKVPMMAYVITRKKDAHPRFAAVLERAAGKSIVEISMGDSYWGAKPQGGRLVGQNVLGGILDQIGSGRRVDMLPAGTSFPAPEMAAALARDRIGAATAPGLRGKGPQDHAQDELPLASAAQQQRRAFGR